MSHGYPSTLLSKDVIPFIKDVTPLVWAMVPSNTTPKRWYHQTWAMVPPRILLVLTDTKRWYHPAEPVVLPVPGELGMEKF